MGETSAGLAWWTRRRRPAAFPWVAAAAASLAAAHGLYWGVVQPVNIEMVRWPLDAIPEDWARWRDRWEYGHAVRAGLVTFALGAMTWSLIVDRSRTENHPRPNERTGESIGHSTPVTSLTAIVSIDARRQLGVRTEVVEARRDQSDRGRVARQGTVGYPTVSATDVPVV